MQLSQTKLFNKKQQEATHQLLTRGCARRLKTTTIYEEKKGKKIRENTPS